MYGVTEWILQMIFEKRVFTIDGDGASGNTKTYGNVSITGDLTITGDLNVSGSTTTVNTTN